MKNNSRISQIIYSVYLLTVLLCTQSVNAMQLVNGDKSTNNVADKFMREFPLMTFKRAYDRYGQCSLNDQKQIEKKISAKNDKAFSFLFNMAAKLPADMKKKIMMSVFNDNNAAADKALRMPIADTVKLWEWSKDVVVGEQARPLYDFTGKDRTEIFTEDNIFELSDGITIMNNILASEKIQNISLGDLTALKDLLVKCPELQHLCHDLTLSYEYRYAHNRLGLNGLLSESCEFTIITSMMGISYTALVSAIIMNSLSKMIELNHCSPIVIESAVQKNEVTRILNESIKAYNTWLSLSENVQHLKMLGSRDEVAIISELTYGWIDSAKLSSPYYLLPILCALINSTLEQKSFIFILGFLSTVGCLLGSLLGLSLVESGYSFSFTFNDGSKVIAGISAIYGFVYFMIYLIISRARRYDIVDFKRIPKLLQRTDIVIH